MRRNARKVSWERFLESKHGILDPQDTISRLPENVLQHMMSFLPPLDKDNVRFLSRKWRRLSAQNQAVLWLTKQRLNELEFPKLLNDEFQSVEFLSLSKCPGMRSLKLMNLKLVTVHLKYCGSLKNLYLNTPNLKTLYFHGPRVRPCTIEFINCQKLTILHLVGVAMNTMMFINCNERFPLLQTLTLGGCDMTGCINISSNSLHKLWFVGFNKPVGLTIDAPNLSSFKYNGSTIAPDLNINLPRLTIAYLELYPDLNQKRDEIWFTRLTEMLHCLKHAKRLEFSTNSDKNVIIPKYLRETLVPPLDEISWIAVRTSSGSANMVNLSDSMLWVSPRVNNLIICISDFWEFILQV
ncbi:putative F-box domain, leucine-rich repeat domain superfamily, F-box-like domain superfamily [Helianthus annuus]|nr:putative F-box domain, leucine-rich repeat domain superfamily, F-box-like domain superfamily [Helianthus annuus]